MFFSKSARILAILALVFGLLSILNGLLVLHEATIKPPVLFSR
jgi:hypothetical protein